MTKAPVLTRRPPSASDAGRPRTAAGGETMWRAYPAAGAPPVGLMPRQARTTPQGARAPGGGSVVAGDEQRARAEREDRVRQAIRLRARRPRQEDRGRRGQRRVRRRPVVLRLVGIARWQLHGERRTTHLQGPRNRDLPRASRCWAKQRGSVPARRRWRAPAWLGRVRTPGKASARDCGRKAPTRSLEA